MTEPINRREFIKGVSADVGGLMPEKLRHQLAPWPPAQISAVLLAQPFHAMQMTEIAGGEQAAAVGDDIRYRDAWRQRSTAPHRLQRQDDVSRRSCGGLGVPDEPPP